MAMSIGRWLFGRRRERGQALILFVGFFSVIMIVGAIVVDFGLAFSERRGAQRDADLSALAGARELAVTNAGALQAAAAQTAVAQWAALNNIGNSSVSGLVVDGSCFNTGVPDAVSVDTNHASSALFSKFLGFGLLNIGAHAKACAGAAESPIGLLPVETDPTDPCFDAVTHQPLYAQPCPLGHGAGTGNPRGLLDLAAPGNYCSIGSGSGDIINMIANGATGTCLINPPPPTPPTCNPANVGPWYNCVAVQPGNFTKVLTGFSQRLARDTLPPIKGGPCDPDTFANAVTVVNDTGNPLTSLYAPTDCDPSTTGLQPSPRLITIFVLYFPPPASGSTGYPIYAFASFYVMGCQDERLPPPPTNWMGTCPSGGPPGHDEVWGRFVNLFLTNVGTGPPTSSTTDFSISLNQ